MTNAKIEFKVGGISFAGEGDEKWMAAQLDKILEKAPQLGSIAEAIEHPATAGSVAPSANTGGSPGTLAAFLQKSNAGTNQNKRFLATAEWLLTCAPQMVIAAGL